MRDKITLEASSLELTSFLNVVEFHHNCVCNISLSKVRVLFNIKEVKNITMHPYNILVLFENDICKIKIHKSITFKVINTGILHFLFTMIAIISIPPVDALAFN